MTVIDLAAWKRQRLAEEFALAWTRWVWWWVPVSEPVVKRDEKREKAA